MFFLTVFSVSTFTACTQNDEQDSNDLRLAEEAFKRHEIADTEMYYERFLRKNAGSSERWDVWNKLLTIALTIREDKTIAAAYLEIMLEEYANDPEKQRQTKVKLASILEELRQYDQSLELWKSVANDKNASGIYKAQAYRSIGKLSLHQLDFGQVENALKACLQLNVNEKTTMFCQFDLADSQILQGEYPEAEKNLRIILEKHRSNDDFLTLVKFTLADVLELQGKHAEAHELFSSIRLLYPNSAVIELRIDTLNKRLNTKK